MVSLDEFELEMWSLLSFLAIKLIQPEDLSELLYLEHKNATLLSVF